ncbi:MAG: translocation/assembly module TamB domain-containing protein, partial [Bacteroidota bacterium]
PGGIEVRDISLGRDSQEVHASLSVRPDGSIAGELTGARLDLGALRHLQGEEAREGTFSGAASLRLRAGGTLRHPVYDAEAHLENVAFRSIPFGTVRGNLHYAEGSLGIAAMVDNLTYDDPARPEVRVEGRIPLDLSLEGAEEGPGDLRLEVHSDGVQLSILDPLLPTFSELAGTLRGDITLGGTMQKPLVEGALALDSCSFLFVPNNIYYLFDGTFEAAGERVRVADAVLRNIPSDRRMGQEGMMRIGGDFSLRDLKPADFRLTAAGKLLVVKETTRRSALSVYGHLFLETAGEGLTFTGDVSSSLLRGSVLVKNSNLVFPPTQEAPGRETEQAVRLVFVDDTAEVRPEPPRTASTRYFGLLKDTTAGSFAAEPETGGSPSFMDGLRYDLQIESAGGNTEIKMIFNTATGEELVANLDGRFAIVEDGKEWVGTVTIQRAYYNFTRRFDAEGTISFSGDFLNPELNVTARYRATRVRADSAGSDRGEEVVVILTITGTRQAPVLDIAMTIDGVDYYSYSGPKSSDVGSDAIQFLLTGNFPLTESQKNDIAADVRSTVGGSLVTGATSLLSSTLSSFLRRETGFISSIEIGYGEGETFGQSADIRISGVVGDGLWRIGGRVLGDPFNNANVSLLYSLGDIFRRPSLRNFMFELERRVETSLGQLSDRKEINSARLFYRLSF